MDLRAALAAAALALPIGAAAVEEAKPPPAAEPPAATAAPKSALEEVSGVVRKVDGEHHRITVEVTGGEVELGADRNTLVYQPGGATTVLAVKPGVVIKAGLDARRIAYWIQVRAAAAPANPAAAPATPAAPAAAPAPAAAADPATPKP
ncbi:MAG TPA: hypothetical protein VFP50_08075 [Anaeromyxobacteraceae bacterium]|nr:hypothetical protein [Anaeromyxobacteraceae bacterium]